MKCRGEASRRPREGPNRTQRDSISLTGKPRKAFRTEVRGWLEANCPASMRTPMKDDEIVWGGSREQFKNPDSKVWLERMGDKGWTAPEWPAEYVGGGLNKAQARVLQQELRRIRARIGEVDGGALTNEGRQQIADIIGVSLNDVQHMEMRMSGSDSSLNAMIGDNGDNSAQDFLVDYRPNPETSVMVSNDAETLSAWLKEALNDLPDREKMIIQRRRLDDDGSTLEELGIDFGVSKERVRQLEARALIKIRNSLEQRVPEISDLPFLS